MKPHIPTIANLFSFLLVFSVPSTTTAQVGIGTAQPEASSILELSSTNKGLLIPRISLTDVSTSSLDGVNPSALGLMAFNTNSNITGGSGIGFYFWDGVTWDKMASNASNNSWSVNGNELSNSQFLGSTNDQSVRFKVNDVAAGSINTNGSLSL